ncbi:uncharacterized protein PHACADRAFT_264877 [Phanerochaete carnosa HHB-10118-sp]|uniref:BTB domain-containing protein n=1 Tax=Phanerochaete carnosa (strain HHB-10118-sp) TaxID=650164 RepID=K5VTZ1_PHACS|nr:uncharacterized protein PHACADRAFT_264877 [Phanerochaete carnosa HHB-10118-sp]EKM50260.1 hypothetical protein PHACADRAFT_264877 [Phanerochaete carnosa HHB-10118-sp]
MSDPGSTETSDFEQVAEANESMTSTQNSVQSTSSTSEEPTSKEKEEDTAIHPHPEMSFDDGNIMIVAEKTSYRVHRSVLSRKSALFKDLLSLPQPDSEEKLDGLPVVRLLDPAEDVTMLLDAIYNGAKYRYRDDETPGWAIVRRLLNLGTKYQVEELRDEAIHQLNARYPRKIADWDYTCRTDSDTSSTIVVSYPIEEDLVIANVARTMNLPDIHLAALYGCCSLPPDVLVRGRAVDDGTLERLCEDDLVACLQGKENLLVCARADVRLNLFAPDERPEACRYPVECADKTAELLTRYRTAEPRPRRLYDPLRPDDEEIERHCVEAGLCHECVKFFIARHAQLRQNVRNNLTSYICVQKAT